MIFLLNIVLFFPLPGLLEGLFCDLKPPISESFHGQTLPNGCFPSMLFSAKLGAMFHVPLHKTMPGISSSKLPRVARPAWIYVLGQHGATPTIQWAWEILYHQKDGWNAISSGIFTIYQLVQDFFHPYLSIHIWWFPKMGVPPVIIHFRLGFSIK